MHHLFQTLRGTGVLPPLFRLTRPLTTAYRPLPPLFRLTRPLMAAYRPLPTGHFPTCLIQPPERVINAMGIALYGIDAACMAVLAVSADRWEGSARAKEVDTAVMVVQLNTLLGE